MKALLEKLQKLESSALSNILSTETGEALQQLRIEYLGKKSSLSDVLKNLKNLDAKDKAVIGEQANFLRNKLLDAFQTSTNKIQARIVEKKIETDRVDITLPGYRRKLGSIHPLIKVRKRILDIFLGIGFALVDGPEVDTEFCNFEALNVPADHPARDMQNTLYVEPGLVLRTQTSTVQIRTMLDQAPPIKIVAPGAVYRNETVDATHSCMFHQVEGLYIDENVTMEDLKGTLEYFAQEFLGAKIRLRSSFFPFTEPSVEVDFTCIFCKGNGCRICQQTGWIEVLGAGMVHPSLYEKVGYPKDKYSGFAFGIGIERLAMLLFGIDDIRLFYTNDLRFLEQYI